MTDKRTEQLLTCGVLATPLFFVVAFSFAATRPGFDLGPHMLSQLSAGDLGWIQIANFVTSGILYVLGGLGFRRVLTEGPGRIWIPRLVIAFGLGLVAAGAFVADPFKGYPAGAAERVTWHGTVHGAAAIVAGLAMVIALGIFARRFFAAQQRGLAVLTIVVAVVYFVFPFSSQDQAGLMLAIGSVIGWGWLSLLALGSMPGVAARFGSGAPHPA